MKQWDPQPMVVWANHHPFGPGERVDDAAVMARNLLWCESGRGEIICGEESFALEPGHVLLSAWGSDLSYVADGQLPFQVGVVSLVPVVPLGGSLRLGVPREGQTSYQDHASCRDHAVLPSVACFLGDMEGTALPQLLRYIIMAFERPSWRTQEALRALGRLLLAELRQPAEEALATRRGMPALLVRAVKFMETHLDQRPTLHDLVEECGCSRSTLHRLFVQHFGCTPGVWLQQKRMHVAQRLLADTGYGMDQIAGRVGYSTAGHFSEAFKRSQGMTPGAFRALRQGPDLRGELA